MSKSKILLFHGITKEQDMLNKGLHMDKKLFESLIRILKKRYSILSLEKMVSHVRNKTRFPKHSLVITFDDGYENIYTNAYPILQKYDIPATIFLTTGFIGTKKVIWYDKLRYGIYNTNRDLLRFNSTSYYLGNKRSRIKVAKDISGVLKRIEPIRREMLLNSLLRNLNMGKVVYPREDHFFLSWKQVREMSENSNVSFGAHTVNHEILTNLSGLQIKKEILDSKKIIERKISQEVKFFAYPNGRSEDFNTFSKNMLANNGFLCALSTIRGHNKLNSDLFELRRFNANRTLDYILAKLL